LAQLKTVHTVPWSHCPNKNVLSDRLNWPYDSPRSLRLGSRLFQTCGPVEAKVLSLKLSPCALDFYSLFIPNLCIFCGRPNYVYLTLYCQDSSNFCLVLSCSIIIQRLTQSALSYIFNAQTVSISVCHS